MARCAVLDFRHKLVGPLVLRPSVSVDESSDGFLLRYAHWELHVPHTSVATSSALRRLSAERLFESDGDPSTSGLIALLAAQGCFLPALPGQLSLRELFLLLQPIRSELYATYYAHPLWARLREGSASIGELVAWALHNYHISRSAGIIAARMASQLQSPSLREAFRDDALEEYWHCDAFYFVKCERLQLDPARAKAYVPLPAIRAFEDIALRAAETDWLAHLLIAYFQESSIIFDDASQQFYDDVERQYGLPGFFRGWRQHIALDRDHRHAENLASLFDSDQILSRDSIKQSMRTLQFAHYFLVMALDQLSANCSDLNETVELRQPWQIAASHQQQLAAQFAPLPQAFLPLVKARLEEAAFCALAHAREHEDIIVAGTLASVLRGADIPPSAADLDNPWLVAVGNFLVEHSRDLRLLLALADDLLGAFTISLDGAAMAKLADARIAIGAAPMQPLTVARFQLRELIELARNCAPLEHLVIGVPANTVGS